MPALAVDPPALWAEQRARIDVEIMYSSAHPPTPNGLTLLGQQVLQAR